MPGAIGGVFVILAEERHVGLDQRVDQARIAHQARVGGIGEAVHAARGARGRAGRLGGLGGLHAGAAWRLGQGSTGGNGGEHDYGSERDAGAEHGGFLPVKVRLHYTARAASITSR